MAKPLPDLIEATAQRLAQLKARQRLQDHAEKARALRAQKRERAKHLASLLRSADAHRKITLGGVVIAAGADGLDAAELCGWLLAVVEKRTEAGAALMLARGLKHFAEREATRRN